MQIHSSIVAYARSLDVWGRSGKFDVVLPAAWLSGSATFAGQPQERNISGLADPKFRFSVNFYGAPALSLAKFGAYQQDVIVGASVQVTAPAGQYDPDKLVNLGTNRWSVKTELGISKRPGPVTLELTGAGTFYTDNDEFLGHQTRSQDPIYSVQGHVIYSFGSGIWGALDGTYYAGGSTTRRWSKEPRFAGKHALRCHAGTAGEPEPFAQVVRKHRRTDPARAPISIL